MKIRKGFVSNSSSSSFIVAYEYKDYPCPCCGLVKPDIVSYVSDTYSNYENEVEHSSRESIIAELKKDLKDEQKKLKEVEHFEDNVILEKYPCISFNGSHEFREYTVGEKRSYVNENIKRIKEMINKINKVDKNKRVIKVKVAYGDEFLNNMIRTCEILSEDEY